MALDRPTFDSIDIDGALGSAKATCYHFSQTLWDAASAAAAAGDGARQSWLLLIADICSYALRPDSPKEPFVPFAVMNGKRTASIDDLDDEHLGALEGVLDNIKRPELAARVADVLFVRKKHHRFAKAAIDAYLASAESFGPSEWHETTFRLERAHALATIIRSERERVVEKLVKELDARRGDATFFSAKIMQAFADYGSGEPKTMADLAEAAVATASKDGDWHRARDYLLLAAHWYRKLGDVDAQNRTLREAAECYVKLAEHSGFPWARVSHLERAVQSLRAIAGTQARVDQVHSLLVEAQKAAMGEINSFGHSIDVSKSTEQARQQVQGLSPEDAIVAMATIWRPSPVGEVRRQVIDIAQVSVFSSSIQKTIVNRNGKVVARRGPIIGGDPKKQEESIRQAMFEHAASGRELIAVSALRPARAQVAEEHYISKRVLLQFTSRSSFVPLGRADLYAEGLAAGFQGDFSTALHLLVPQVENSIRTILDRGGAITSRIDSDGIQDERDLGALLYMPETATIFAPSLLFELQGLLVERCGSNLRNRFAHGLLDGDLCSDGQSVYLWWLALFLVVLPLVAKGGQDAEGPGKSGGDV